MGCHYTSILFKEEYPTTKESKTFFHNSGQWFIKTKKKHDWLRLLLVQKVLHGTLILMSSSASSSSSSSWKNYLFLPRGQHFSTTFLIVILQVSSLILNKIHHNLHPKQKKKTSSPNLPHPKPTQPPFHHPPLPPPPSKLRLWIQLCST